MLEAYYEPQFSEHSHGYRPQRGCHTALRHIEHAWTGCHWFVEGDIRACFDQLDHSVMLSILAEKIHDPRFLRLIKHLLQAGYLQEWRYLPTLSGVPQGGTVSPVLSNIYLNQLDHYVETHLIPQYTRGRVRKKNPAYRRIQERLSRARRKGDYQKAKTLLRQAQHVASVDPNDPGYRRLRYVRYADDVRHLTHYSIPLGERRSSEEMTSGSLGPPGGENQRGNEHAEKAEKRVKTLKPCSARPA